MRIADVVVVGGGPAGTAAAISLARAGSDVVLVDKATFPRDKFCGDGLTTNALRLLEKLGLDPTTVPSWKVIHAVNVRSPSGRLVQFPLPEGAGQYAVVAERQELDNALVELARKEGVDVLDGHACTGASESRDGVVVMAEGVGEIAGGHAVAADGIWSPMRKYLGVHTPDYRGEWHAFRQYFTNVSDRAASELFVLFEPDFLPGYAWSFPLPGNRANVGFGIQRGHKQQINEMKQLWQALLQRPHIHEILGPNSAPEGPYRSWPIPARIDDITYATERTLFVGDAVGACDPMTGEGIAQALHTGIRAAEAIAAGGEVTRRYSRAVERDLVADHKMSTLLIRALKHRKGARAGVRIAGLTAWTRRNFARWLFEDYPRAIIVTPRRWKRGMFTGPGAFRSEL
ncbi:MAG: 3-(3-hydroxy-phenyl)propionate/3-hydroxycinnamic acid hydroxylase [Acidimicrobiales bacterium]|nr:3-(3-hydroxy-phenyl)propionate/3-hydroxycinnamic acid hydroxylase [Acidimicrobiales bacterium]RIK08392.1 MAG: hypothetical protein DCC48_00105 [Acidobacteriota bacterium]